MKTLLLKDQNLKDIRVLIRSDLNVPLKNGKITSYARIKASLPTIKFALEKGAKVMVTSHLGRPVEGEYTPEFSLKPIADYLAKELNINVKLEADYLNGVDFSDSNLLVLENVRFNLGEKKNKDELAKKYASLCDIFVMDAFGTAHRAQASTHGVAKYAPVACAGPLLENELKALEKALDNPARPMVSIVGGSKVSTKLTVLNSLGKLSDQLIVGGGIANTFILSQRKKIGTSLVETDLVNTAKELDKKFNIVTTKDVVVAKEFSQESSFLKKNVDQINQDEMILDLGQKTANEIAQILLNAKTILWNGPVGVFEFDNFAKGTEIIAKAIAKSDAFSIAGGGDTLAAIDKFNVKDKISYISTGGGAFLEFVEGKTLPAVAILEKRAQEK